MKPEWITTSEFLKKWLENYAETHAGGRTLERYEYTVNHRLFPALGHWPLSKLTPLSDG